MAGDSIGEVTRAQLDGWSERYGTQHRQLRRWIALGRAVADPCPLDDPAKMPEWWTRHKTWACPAKILHAAHQAIAAGSAPPPPPSEPSPPSATAAPAAAPTPAPNSPLDISSFQLEEGESVTLMRQIAGALGEELREAYLRGWPTDSLQTRLNKATANLRALEKDDREAGIHRGKYTLTAERDRDLAVLAAMLKQMRDSMVRRVLESCPSLLPDQRAEVSRAIAHVRAQEDRIFQRADRFHTPADLTLELGAAA